MCPDKGELRNVLLPTNLLVMLVLKDYYWYSGDSELLNVLLPETLELLELFEPLMDADHQIVPPAEMWNFVLNQLRDHGLFAQALSHIRAHWGKMIKTGTPTLWEIGVYPVYTEKRDAESAHSLCHGFCTTPVNYFQTAILGVRPISPGFGTFEAILEAHDLEFAEGSIPTPKGNFKISVNKAACSRRS